MVTIIILIILLVLSLIIVPFSRQLAKDKIELADNPIERKFEVLASILNEAFFEGKGEINTWDDDPRLMRIFSDYKKNMIIDFYYSTGNLSLTLKYKFLQKELEHKEVFNHLRSLTVYRQKDIANQFIEVCQKKIVQHQQNVGFDDVNAMSGIQNFVVTEDDPTSIISSMYEGLTTDQKKSIINLMYMIGTSAGDDELRVRKTVAFSNQALSMNVRPDDCIKQLKTYGTEKIFSDLQGIEDSGVMDMVVLSCFQLVAEMNMPNLNNINPAMEDCFYQSFERLGYSEQDIEQVIQKINAMQQYFGL